jgi:hypothetical protein
MTEEFEKGDKVKWKSPQGDVIGEVKKKIVSPMEIKGQHVSASKDNPQYLVKSDKTGDTILLRNIALTKGGYSYVCHNC